MLTQKTHQEIANQRAVHLSARAPVCVCVFGLKIIRAIFMIK